jgi:serine/threonine-protein kinase RsbW
MTGLKARFDDSVLATPQAIAGLLDRVMAFLAERGVEPRPVHHTGLILEEILINLGTHGNCRDRPARISVTVGSDKITGEIVDSGKPFDPRLAPNASLDGRADDRPIGGLGLFLVQKLSCSLEYTRRNDENCTIFAVSRQAEGQNELSEERQGHGDS